VISALEQVAWEGSAPGARHDAGVIRIARSPRLAVTAATFSGVLLASVTGFSGPVLAAQGPTPVVRIQSDRSVHADEPVTVAIYRVSKGASVTVAWGDGATTRITGGCPGTVAAAHPRRCSARVQHAYQSAGRFTILVTRAPFRAHRAVLHVTGAIGGSGSGQGSSAPPAPVTSRPAAQPTGWQERMLSQVNSLRAAAGAPALTWCDRLGATAQDYATVMAQTGHYGHVGADGSEPWDRMTAHGYQWHGAAENIAAGYDDVDSVMVGWRNSSGHYANIVNPSFEHVGFGSATTASGPYGTYWVQNFGYGGSCS
jgi:uncharacterized protein YkwD